VISVAVVDDDRMLLDGLRCWLEGVPELRLLSLTASVDELDAGHGATADVVLLDLVLRDGSRPVDNIRRLREAGHRVLIISTVPDRAQIVASMRAGADGYLTKDHDLPTLVTAIRQIADGGIALSPELAFAWARDNSHDRPKLSPKETCVLLDYASGLTLKATARRAGISPHTAKDYLDRVKAKYRLTGRPAYTKSDLAERIREDGL
jgi:DNA-binding NarL/FixJ family response regulator